MHLVSLARRCLQSKRWNQERGEAVLSMGDAGRWRLDAATGEGFR